MEMKAVFLLAILGVAYATKSATYEVQGSVNYVEQVSIALQSSNHTSLLDLPIFKDAKEKLQKVDLSKITDLTKLPELTSTLIMPPLIDLRESIDHARSRLAAALGQAEATAEEAVYNALIEALHAADALKALSEVIFTILSTYFHLAVEAPLGLATAAIMAEGVELAVNSVHVVVGAVAVI